MSRRAALRGAAWWLGAALVAHAASQLLEDRPLGAAVISAVAVDLIATRAAGPWLVVDGRAPWRRASVGLALGFAVVAAAALALTALGSARASFTFAPLSLALSVVGAVAVAVKTELLARHLPHALFGRALGARGGAVVCVLAGAAPVALGVTERPLALLVALATGLLSVAALRAWGAVAAVGVRAGLLFAAASLFGDFRWSRGGLSPLELASGPPAAAVSVAALLAAAVVARGALARGREPTKPRVDG